MAIRDLTQLKRHLFLCEGGTCKNKGAEESIVELRRILKDQGLDPDIHTTKTLCNGRCNDGPIVVVLPECHYYKNIRSEAAADFVRIVLEKNEVWSEHLLYAWSDPEMQTSEPEN
jgi:(2Fe-2S) ferredoxin